MNKTSAMKCDIVIPVWNQLEYTKKCVRSIKLNTTIPYQLIIIDNASDTETATYLYELDRKNHNITVIRNDENLGFIKAVNQGLRQTDAPYICIMNNDTVATSRWLAKMINLAESRSDIGLVNPKCETPPENMSFNEYAEVLAGNKGKYVETNQCMGFCMLIKRELISKIGLLDEVYGVGGFDDTEFSMRAHKLGYKCVSASDAYVFHDWHTSFNKAGNREELVKRNEKIFFGRWGKHLRIAYPILNDSEKGFADDICTSIGLAREWNWVHAWFSANKKLGSRIDSLSLPKHQSLRMFYLGKNKVIFSVAVLCKLIERSLKKKKHYDAVLISDPDLFKTLQRFKKLFKTPLVYVKKDKSPIDVKDENTWNKRAQIIKNIIKEETQK